MTDSNDTEPFGFLDPANITISVVFPLLFPRGKVSYLLKFQGIDPLDSNGFASHSDVHAVNLSDARFKARLEMVWATSKSRQRNKYQFELKTLHVLGTIDSDVCLQMSLSVTTRSCC